MKKTLNRGLAVLLSATLIFCALALPSYAASEDCIITGDPDNTFETAYEVTGSFTASIDVWVTYYKFTPTQSGYYRVSANSDESIYFWAYDSAYDDLGYGDGSFWTNDYGTGFDACLKLEAGETYYFEFSVYFEGVVLTCSPITFDVDMAYLGDITGAMLVSPPDKLTYIQDYDDCYFDITGAFADVTFSEGQTVTLCDNALDYVFERSYDGNMCHLGANTVNFMLGDTVMFSFVITFIENPIESIEVVRLPDKTDYTFGIDGELNDEDFFPNADLTGLQVKINYTDSTSKTVDWVDEDPSTTLSDCYYWSFWKSMEIDGYTMSVDNYSVEKPGETTFYVYYLNQTAEFTINITSPSFFEKVQIFFTALSSFASESFILILFMPDYYFSELPYHAELFFSLIYNLSKM